MQNDTSLPQFPGAFGLFRSPRTVLLRCLFFCGYFVQFLPNLLLKLRPLFAYDLFPFQQWLHSFSKCLMLSQDPQVLLLQW